MAKEITLKMTKAQFRAMVSMIEDNATMIACADADFSTRTKRNLRTLQRAINNSGINYKLSY